MTFTLKSLSLSLILLSASLSHNVLAEQSTGTFKISEATSNNLTLYPDKALVLQNFNVQPSPEGIISLTGLETSWQQDSLQFEYKVGDKVYAPLSLSWRNTKLNRNWLYSAMVGKSVELIGGGLNVPVQGTMLTYQDGLALVKGSNGRQYIVDRNDGQGIRIASREELFHEKDYQSQLVASFPPVESGGNLSMSYIATDLSYSNHYRMTVSGNHSGNIDLTVLIKNNSANDFTGADVQLVAGSHSMRGPVNRKLFASQPMMEAVGADRQERVGEVMVLKLPELTSVPARSSQQLTLYKNEQLKLTPYYQLNYYGRSYNSHDSVQERPEFFLRFKADRDLPPGSISIYDQGSDGQKLISGMGYINKAIKGENVDISNGEALAVIIKRQRLKQRQSSDTIESRWKAVITNDQKEEVTLFLTDRDQGLNRIKDIKGATGASYNTMKVVIPAEGVQEISYTSIFNK